MQRFAELVLSECDSDARRFLVCIIDNFAFRKNVRTTFVLLYGKGKIDI